MITRPLLIVEDDPDGQEVVTRMLRMMNIETDIAGTAEEAWSKLQTELYGGVIIDLALPGQDGFQLIDAIRGVEALKQLPCIAVTAYHTPELKRGAIERGFDAYFPKPLNRTLFLGAVDEIMSK